MVVKRTGLGRGLEALLGSPGDSAPGAVAGADTAGRTAVAEGLRSLPVDLLVRGVCRCRLLCQFPLEEFASPFRGGATTSRRRGPDTSRQLGADIDVKRRPLRGLPARVHRAGLVTQTSRRSLSCSPLFRICVWYRMPSCITTPDVPIHCRGRESEVCRTKRRQR